LEHGEGFPYIFSQGILDGFHEFGLEGGSTEDLGDFGVAPSFDAEAAVIDGGRDFELVEEEVDESGHFLVEEGGHGSGLDRIGGIEAMLDVFAFEDEEFVTDGVIERGEAEEVIGVIVEGDGDTPEGVELDGGTVLGMGGVGAVGGDGFYSGAVGEAFFEAVGGELIFGIEVGVGDEVTVEGGFTGDELGGIGTAAEEHGDDGLLEAFAFTGLAAEDDGIAEGELADTHEVGCGVVDAFGGVGHPCKGAGELGEGAVELYEDRFEEGPWAGGWGDELEFGGAEDGMAIKGGVFALGVAGHGAVVIDVLVVLEVFEDEVTIGDGGVLGGGEGESLGLDDAFGVLDTASEP
jgi:hypothetical protein